MATSQMSEVVQQLRRIVLREGAGLTDGQLLEDYISRRDEAALAALVRRHGPMVWGVCRRVLRNYQDVEDAFQATFLVLVRKAAFIASRELLVNWLYGVVRQTALKARATAAKRKGRERQVAEMPEPAVAEQELWHDLQPLLDDELSRLPDKYRSVILLCDLEGKTRREAAQELGVPDGTVGGWLARARAMLAKRLAQRGVALSGVTLAALLSQNVASAGVPTSVMSSTIKAASLFAARQAATAGAISANVAALTEGVLKTMLVNKLKTMAAFIVVAAVFVSGGVALPFISQAEAKADRQAASPSAEAKTGRQAASSSVVGEQGGRHKDQTTVKGRLDAVQADKNSVTVSVSSGRGEKTPKTFEVAKDATIEQESKKVKLADLKTGNPTTLKLSPDLKTVVSITVEGETISGKFKSADAERNTITVFAGRNGDEKIFHLGKETKVLTVDNKETTVKNVKEGATLLLTLSLADRNTAVRIQAVTEKTRN